MQIDHYISKLLYHHDCVVVPGFGGFVTNYAPAKIHPVNHTFYPPSKSILFNSKLTQNDGLLQHNIAISEKIPYEEAKRMVENFVWECKLKLKQGESIILDKIGTISKDIEGSLLFDPDKSVNYLEDSYGLTTFISPPVVREPMHKRLEKKFIDRKPVPERTGRIRKIHWAYLALIPVLLLIGWFTFKTGFRDNTTQKSSLVPSSEQTSPEKAANTLKVENKTEIIKDLNLSSNDAEMNIETSLENTASTAKPVSNRPKYYIIGGAFRYKANSEKLIATLRQKGYDANSAGQNPRGLYMVCYFSTEDKAEALMNLAMIRKDDNSAAWLLKK